MTVAPREIEKPRSFLRNALPVTAFMLVAGIVGPIFLVIGLSIDAPDAGWMIPVGLAITLLDIGIGLYVGWRRTKAQHKTYRLRLNGKPAVGHIQTFEQTGVRVNDQPMVTITLRIAGDDVAAFDAVTTSVIPEVRMPLLYGKELPVIVDRESGEWEIDWANARPTATTSGVVPDTDGAPADRLTRLDDLLRRDLISREEYDATRARILDEI